MMRGVLTVGALASALFFPWPFTALLALCASVLEPMVPLAVGIFTDTLYYAPGSGMLPVFTLCGAALSAFAFFVRSRLTAGSMEG